MTEWPSTITTNSMPADVGHTVGQGGLKIHGPEGVGAWQAADSFYVEPTDIWVLQNIPLDKIDSVEGANISVSAEEWNELHGGEKDYTSVAEGIRSGRLDPLVVIPTDQGTYAVEDGWHRATMAKDMGIEEFPAYVLDESQRQRTASWQRVAEERNVLYHITDQPRFTLDPNRAPQDNSFSISDRSGRKGIYLTDNPDRWRAQGYRRPYVAEIHVPEGLARPERWHGEMFLPAEHFDEVDVRRVIPFDVHQQEKWGDIGTVERYHGTPASTPADKDVRDFTREEHTEHLQRLRDYLHGAHGWGWNEFDEQGNHIGVDEFDDEGMPIRRDRNGNVMTRGRYASKTSMGERGDLPDIVIQNNPTQYGGETRGDDLRYEALLGEEMIGFMELRSDAGTYTISDVYVKPEWRRRGVATALLNYAEGQVGTYVHHDEGNMSADAEAWAEHTGGKTAHPPRQRTAMPYDNNVWYHVTHKDNLQSIRDHGLVPTGRGMGNASNWADYSVVTDGVYLSPTVTGAEAVREGMGRSDSQWKVDESTILKITEIDQRRLHPDPEEMTSHLEDLFYDYEQAGGLTYDDEWLPLIEMIGDAALMDAAGITVWENYQWLEPEQRDAIKQSWADRAGVAWVYVGTIPAQSISVFEEDDLEPADRGVDPMAYYDDTEDDAASLYRFNPMFSKVREAHRKMAKPSIAGPLPFIYSIDQDVIYAGHPGERHSDIKGKFAPGGVVRGFYMPNGEMQIRAETDMPYTLFHMSRLWYYLYPELEIKSITMLQDGKKIKLASKDVAHKVRNIAFTFPAARKAFEALSPHGTVYVVGGAIRDVVLGKTPHDIDMMVSGIEPDMLEDLLAHVGKVDFTGQNFGVYRLKTDDDEVEIALPRTERSTGGGHKDFEIVTDHTLSVEEDLARRDFSINSMAVNLNDGELIDPYDGVADLVERKFRSINEKAFDEDPLRILRALTALSKHGVEPDERTVRAMQGAADTLKSLPAERVGDELDKILSGSQPQVALRLAMDLGLLQEWLPEIQQMQGFDQKSKYHNLTLDDHTFTVLENMVEQTDDIDLRWAALLHDSGKPTSQWEDTEGFAHYYYDAETDQGAQHEEVGAELASDILRRLKRPEKTVQRVSELISHHMFPGFESPKGARKFMRNVGDHADDVLSLRWSDDHGKADGDPERVSLMRQLIEREREQESATTLRDLAVNGHDLMELGYQRGEALGRTLQWLLDQVLEDPALNQRDTLLDMARQALVS